jgi:hypothetical protein
LDSFQIPDFDLKALRNQAVLDREPSKTEGAEMIRRK